jgi:hypothetical protein
MTGAAVLRDHLAASLRASVRLPYASTSVAGRHHSESTAVKAQVRTAAGIMPCGGAGPRY